MTTIVILWRNGPKFGPILRLDVIIDGGDVVSLSSPFQLQTVVGRAGVITSCYPF